VHAAASYSSFVQLALVIESGCGPVALCGGLDMLRRPTPV